MAWAPIYQFIISSIIPILIFSVMVRIQIGIAMKISKTFDPDTRFTAISFIVYPEAVAAGAPPVQVPREDPGVVKGGHVHQGCHGRQGGWERLTNDTLLDMVTIFLRKEDLSCKGGTVVKSSPC